MDRQRDVHARSITGWRLLSLVLIIEVIGGAAVVWNVVQAFAAAANEPLGARLSLLLAVLISWAWVIITLIGAMRSRPGWARGSGLTIHVLMFAAATGVLQGMLGDAEALGWGLIVLAFSGFLGAVLARPEMPADSAPGAH